MKTCLVECTPEALAMVLGLPVGATIDAISASNRLGVFFLRVLGCGQEVAPGERIQRAVVIFRDKEFEGEKWHQAGLEMLSPSARAFAPTIDLMLNPSTVATS